MYNFVSSLMGIRNKTSYEGSVFQSLYEKLLTTKDAKYFNEKEKLLILKYAVFFFSQDFDDARKLGYRIIVAYANLFKEFIPLYDVALNTGFVPVAKFIEKNYLNKDRIDTSFFNVLLSSYKDNFKEKGVYLSLAQKELVEFSRSIISDSLIVAPTSYGKSEMIVTKVEENLSSRICIIVPSKALLAQTKKRLLSNENIASKCKRVITHPEMYKKGAEAFVAVLTQERLLRLIQQDQSLSLDLLMVDEAHNLLDKEQRAELLLQVLLILRKRNPETKLHFFTPFIVDPSSIQTKYSDYVVTAKRSQEFIKIEKYFLYDFKRDRSLSLYDQFIDKYISIETLQLSEMEFIWKYKAPKNIIYANRPRDVERLAQEISDKCGDIDFSHDISDEFKDARKAISEYLHPDYALLRCIKKGVVYHHGKVPEIIRLYVEKLFREHKKFEFIVTTSTLLEGVNIPAERIFLLSVDKGLGHLKKSDFKNLTGRVCRFSEIFSDIDGDLRMLQPEIYLINGWCTAENFNPRSFYEKKAKISQADKDDIGNILLKEPANDDEKKKEIEALEYIENIEPGTISLDDERVLRKVDSEIAKACFRNNVYEFDIHKYENLLIEEHGYFKDEQKIDCVSVLISRIDSIFIRIINRDDNERRKDHFDLARLENSAAQNFYSFFLTWKMEGSSYSKMISSYLSYWEKRESEYHDPIIYVGSAWGEIKRNDNEILSSYVDIRNKSRSERVNLAIVKIKEESDFIEYKLLKYVEILNDLSMLDVNFYEKIKYGSTDKRVICMLKNGISIELANCLLGGEYDEYIEFDLSKDEVRIKKQAIEAMKSNNENKILVFELDFHV
jgi:hypothetical protein